MRRPKYCPHCGPNPLGDGSDTRLERHHDILYCNATGEGGCGFHYDIRKEKRFRWVNKRIVGFWMLLSVLTFFYASVQRREYET